MKIYAWATSDVGRKRRHNEDSYLLNLDVQLFAVADGMGGYNGGEVASDLAVRAIDRHVHEQAAALHDGGTSAVAAVMIAAVKRANTVVKRAGDADPALRGMGTTTTGLLFRGARAYVAHVGDSRAYLVRGGTIRQISEDHSLVAQQVRAGLITREQAEKSPYKNIITRSVGITDDVDVDVSLVEVADGDTFLLCSDGLSGLVSDDEIKDIVVANFLHTVPDVLVDLANERGGGDNITVVVCCAVADGWADVVSAVRPRSP